jgi:hypothetical protein
LDSLPSCYVPFLSLNAHPVDSKHWTALQQAALSLSSEVNLVVYERTDDNAGSLDNGRSLGDKESNLVVGDQHSIKSNGLSAAGNGAQIGAEGAVEPRMRLKLEANSFDNYYSSFKV